MVTLFVAGAVIVACKRSSVRILSTVLALTFVVGGFETASWGMLIVAWGQVAVARGTNRRSSRGATSAPELADEVAAALSNRHDLREALARGRRFVGAADLVDYDDAIRALAMGASDSQVLDKWGSSDTGRGEFSTVLAALSLASTMRSPRPLRDLSVMLRVRRLRREDLATQVAQARASAMVVSAGPWVVLGVASVVEPDHLANLASSDTGRWCVWAAATLTLVGMNGMRGVIRRSGLE